ncbi:hypothetical protein DEU34_1881 [Microbacterium sp. AG1240]|uniref:hypothetical protein n=1 Tax=Microbacterium sp. AG1240 TaxID=2183992 RepID=UPI000EAFBCAE|nr:hypothetical protein [Microbacterium sp. AG1240]RKT33291.1 hypothetical protein DEU34_1881 [Microbacterium sp. AG1240]
MRRGSVIATVCAVAGMLLLSGCGGAPGIAPEPRDEASIVDEMVCADALGEAEGSATPGIVPAGFALVAVYRCGPFATRELDGGVVWSGTLVERFEGDLAPLLSELGAPSDPRWFGACAASMVIAPDLWAEDAAGRFVRLSYPSTGCSQPKVDAVDGQLARLVVADEVFTPLSIFSMPEAVAAGCETRASVTVLNVLTSDLETPRAAPAGESIATIPHDPPALPVAADVDVDGLRVCVYASDTTEGGVRMIGDEGVFAGVLLLDAADAAAALAEVSGAAEASAHCPEVASRFVVAQPLGARSGAEGFTVELDGCRRVIDPAFRTLAASEMLISLVTPS